MVERKSSDEIAPMYGAKARTVRDWFYEYGIKLLGAAHLRKGKSATWNVGRKRGPEEIKRLRLVNVGRPSPFKGAGSRAFNCEVCGLEVFDKPYRRRRTCSKACRDRMMSIQRGERHWNYKDGAIAGNQRKRQWADCFEWRRAVIARDEKKCIACGCVRRLSAHHIDGWAKNPTLRFEVSNGATLCHDCHWAFHRTHSHHAATRQQFEGWITIRLSLRRAAMHW